MFIIFIRCPGTIFAPKVQGGSEDNLQESQSCWRWCQYSSYWKVRYNLDFLSSLSPAFLVLVWRTVTLPKWLESGGATT